MQGRGPHQRRRRRLWTSACARSGVWVPRIALTSLEGMEALAYPLRYVRSFRVTENSQPVP